MSDLRDIELAAEDHRRARDALEKQLSELEEQTRTLQKEHLPQIRAAHAKAKESQLALAQFIEDGREHFAKPKTRIVHGLKLGYRKAPDKWQWPSDLKLVALIRKHCTPDLAETLTDTKTTPVKPAIKKLSESLQRKLGILIRKGSDELVIDPVEGELERLMQGLLGDVRAQVEADD